MKSVQYSKSYRLLEKFPYLPSAMSGRSSQPRGRIHILQHGVGKDSRIRVDIIRIEIVTAELQCFHSRTFLDALQTVHTGIRCINVKKAPIRSKVHNREAFL